MGTWNLIPPVGNFSFALFGKTRNGVLGLLFGHPDESFYVREIARTLGSGQGAVQRELESLEKSGILVRSTRGRQVFYQANSQSPIFEEIKSLVSKTVGGVQILNQSLAPLADKIQVAFIFGSMAQGQQHRDSDVDLFIVGDVSFGDVVEALDSAQKKLVREINPVTYPIAELQEKISRQQHFVMNVLRGPKLFLIGGERELAELVGPGLDPKTQEQP
jgi:predicted nucleotidyltransferase